MIRAVLFAIAGVFVRLFSLLPFAVLNVISEFIFFLLNKVIHYREKIILKNLRRSFPDSTPAELKRIKTRFYRYLARLFIENIKMFNLSLNQLDELIELENPGLIERYFRQGRDVAVMAAHFGNWEWLLGLRKDIPHHSIGIYKSMNNRYFDRFFRSHRSKYGTELVKMREVPRTLLKHRSNKLATLTVFISDQSPVWEEIQYWTNFLNQNTAVYLGPEKLARKMNMAVVYFRVKVKDKNRYRVEAVEIAEDASKTEDYEVTENYLTLLEEDIRKQPEFWLWSHRRWKLTEKREGLEKKGIIRFKGNFRKK